MRHFLFAVVVAPLTMLASLIGTPHDDADLDTLIERT